MRILVVEDDPHIRRSLQLLFTSYNYAVDVATDGESGQEMAEVYDYDLILLDLMLPGINGLSLCQQLRTRGFQCPILLLTGQGETQQKTIALNAGADDYVVKPFDTEELIARVQALLRRGRSTLQPTLTWGLLSINPARRRVAYGTHLLSLTPKEHAILELLLRSPQKVFSARDLLNHAWTSIEFPGEEAVRAHIKQLRQKLSTAGAPKDFILTQHGVGYQLNPNYSNFLTTHLEQQVSTPHMAELAQVNEELLLAFEELQVTQEELQVQNDELLAVQQTLELERQRYQDLFDLAPNAYLVTDPNGVVEVANRAAVELLGIAHELLVGSPLIGFVALSNRPEFRQRLAHLNFVENWEITLQPHQSDPIPVLVAVKNITNLQHQLVGLRWSLHNIRPRKVKEQQLQASHDHLEASLQQNEERLRLALELNSIGMWEWHVPTGTVSWNIDHYRLLGYQPETTDASYAHWRDRVHPDDLPLVEQKIAQALETQSDYLSEYRVLLPNGRVCWLMDKGRALYDHAGRPLRMIGVSFDISDRKHSEAALRQSEEKYRTLFNSIDEGYLLAEVIFDQQDQPVDMFYLEVNPAAIALVGQDITGQRLSQINPEVEPYWYEVLGRVARTGWGERFEQYSSQEQSWFDCYVFKIGGSNSHQVAIVFQNITLRKRREANTTFLIALAETLSHGMTPEELMQIVGEKMGDHLHLNHCNFCAINEAEDEVVYLGRWNTPDQTRLPDRIRFSEQVSGDFRRRAQAGETLFSSNTETTPPPRGEANAEIGAISFITVPLHKDGQWKYLFSVSDSRPRRWRNDEIELVEEVANHIFPRLERAQVETALRENEQLLRLALTGAKAGTWDWELATGKLTLSPEISDLHGLTAADALNGYEYWYTKRLHPEDRQWVDEYVSQVLSQRQSELQLEFRILHPQLGTRWVLSLGHLTLNEQGEPVRLSGINLDISDRKQAEQKILEQAALLDIASDAIVLRDLDHRILYWNRGAEKLFGWQAEEAIGQIAYELLNHDRSQNPEIMTTLLNQGEWQGEMHKLTKTGKEVIIASRWTLARSEAGHPTSILSVDTDVTEKKQFETQFYRAQRLESLGTLASGIAHDLNNVLTPILTISQLLRLQPLNLNDEEQEMLQMIEESAKRGSSLIRQILTFSRGTRGECTSVQVVPILQEVIHVAQQTFSKAISIDALLPDQPLWSVYADSTYLHQVLMNLCVNARDAMPEGGILTLTIENGAIDEAFVESHLDAKVGNFVVITVADTGTGIPPAVRDRIFEPFFTTKPTGQGTGLGLATVLGIIRNYGGFMQVLSEVGSGTQMKVYLPALEEPTPDDDSEAKSYIGNWELILLVDDDQVVQHSTRVLLENNFYMTLVASDGPSAIELYSQHHTEITVVLLDIMMPGMSGIELIEQLKAINPMVKTMAMSGLLTHQNGAIAAGANLFLAKPFTTETFLKQVRHLITDCDR